jgi:HSP20 family protein
MSDDKKVEIKKKEKSNGKKQEDKKTREIAVRRESPFSLFQDMDRMFNELRSNFFDDWYFPFRTRRRRPFSLIMADDEPIFRTPLANITEDKDNFSVIAELPGMDKKDIEITITEGNLEIKGEIKEEKKEEKEGELVRREFHSSKYYRAFSLPDNINADKIEANLDKGVLTVKIPKAEPPKPEKKVIEVN